MKSIKNGIISFLSIVMVASMLISIVPTNAVMAAPEDDLGNGEEIPDEISSVSVKYDVLKAYNPQRISFKLGDTGAIINKVKLYLTYTKTDTKVSFDASKVSGNNLTFDIKYDSLKEGTYKLYSVDYSINGTSKTILFSDRRLSYEFKVVKTLDNTIKNYSAVFDPVYYWNKYPDLKKKYKKPRDKYDENALALLDHFIKKGMKQKRQGNKNFNVNYYYNRYSGLRVKYRKNWGQYYLHYIRIGKAQKLDAKTRITTLRNPVTKLNGVQYKSVYDYKYYLSKYKSLNKKFKNDDVGALEYFIKHGMKKKHVAKKSFDVMSYYNKYPKLRKKYGLDWKQYYLDYIKTGKEKGRVATGVTSIKKSVTKYKGTDYSAVYNFYDYISNYPDVAKKYAKDEAGALKHFVTLGMKKGRIGKNTTKSKKGFDVKIYYKNYPDLRLKYGKNWKSYYKHYINTGKKQKRNAWSKIKHLTKYNGINYSRVYDYDYYVMNNPDVVKMVGYKDKAVLKHFVNYGMSERRQAKKSFNVMGYYRKYPDLRNAFATSWPNYYWHFITYGKNEGRVAKADAIFVADENDIKIMGPSQVTADQLAAFYKKGAAQSGRTFPTYYKTSQNITLKKFCKIYIEEAKREGVRAEVGFAQMIQETGWLAYRDWGGRVPIESNNVCGHGAIDSDENAWETYPSIRIGIRAQMQHLKGYASTENLNSKCVDGRWGVFFNWDGSNHPRRGSAPYVRWLGQKENPEGWGWATDPTYGDKLTKLVNRIIKGE